MDELKQCPFCGGEAELKQSEPVDVEGRIWWRVLCKKAGCFANHNNLWNILPDEAIDAWNTRYEHTCRNVDEFGDNIGGLRDWETDGFGFTCSECGYVLHPDEMGASPLVPELLEEPVKINYCPNCGARVVN